jgi:hypothetical protein
MAEEKKTLQIGVSRPALAIQDLPTPEEVFKIPSINFKRLVKFVIGPSLIALGVSIGSGEWLLGPLNVATYGFVGIGWVILISAVLQTFYNVEVARFTVATGETPIVAFGRTPPGFLFWMPFAVVCFYMAFIWGGWAAGCGQALFAIIHGRANTPQEITEVRWLGVALLGVVFVVTLFGKKISRTLELWNGFMVAFILISLAFFVLAFVPFSTWVSGFASLVTPAMPPKGSDARLLGGLAGFTATAAGLNWFILGYYRDKGYGMGHRTGFIAGLVGGKQEQILHAGVTFPENEKNASLWKRWFRLLVVDQWAVFFVGAILGMMLPCILVGHLASMPGADKATSANIPVYAGMQMSKQFGGFFFYWAQLVGLFVLFSTQMVVFETLVRNFVDAAYSVSGKFREMVHGDPRLFYYPFMVVLAIVISILIFSQLPADLIITSANMSNFASLFFPLVMMYLNSKLPRPANITWWSYLVLALNVIFFGFFFLNFAAMQFPAWFTGKLGSPLIKF